MLAPLATRSLARRAAAITRARPATSSSAFSTSPARAVEKGPAGVPISGGDGGNTLVYAMTGLGGAGLIYWYFSATKQAQKSGSSAGGQGIVQSTPVDEKKSAAGTRLAPGAQEDVTGRK